MNSEIAFLKKQHATKDNYFQEEILFLRKSLNEAFQKLNKQRISLQQNKTNLPSHITEQDHRTEREAGKNSSFFNLRHRSNQDAYLNTESSSRKLPDKIDTTDGGSKKTYSEPKAYSEYCHNICYEKFFLEPCVTLTYLEP